MKTPWINYKRMKEVSSMQVNYIEWTDHNERTNSIGNTPHLDSICEISDTEKDIGPPLAEESEFISDLDSICELSILSDSNVEEEIVHPLESAVVDETHLVEKQDFNSQIDSNVKFVRPSESDVEEEIVHPPESAVGDETHLVEKQDFEAQIDSDVKFVSPSESDVENKMNRPTSIEEIDKNKCIDHVNTFSGLVCSVTQKYPFSTHVEIDDFLHAPIFGEIIKNTYEFLDLNNHLTPHLETKLFTTTKYYPEQPDCRLIRSKINEFIFFTRAENYDKHSKKNNPSKAVVEPLHTKLSKKSRETTHSDDSDDFMYIRVPVVVGEYKIEFCLEENIVFEKGIAEIKDISNEVVITDCRFVPKQSSQSLGNGTCKALKGVLFIEGYLHQNIEYTAFHTRNTVTEQNESFISSNQLCQKIVLELIIHILQVQQIRVN